MFTFEVGRRWIYVLELEKGKYYVGQTDNLIKRIKKHGTKHGAAWTNIYKPINFYKIIDNGICTEEEILKKENEITIELMTEFGWLNVRGGSFSNPNEQIIYYQLLNSELVVQFEFIMPEIVEQNHILNFYHGMHRSEVKIDVFNEYDKKTRATIFASISGTFSSKTNTIEKLKVFNCEEASKQWFEQNLKKYLNISFGEVLGQFEKLMKDKEKRLFRNEKDERSFIP